MADEQTQESTVASDTSKKSSGLPTIAKVAIGCFVVLVVLGVLSTLVVGWVMKKAGTAIVEKAIESKTGVKTDIEDISQGKMTFTDEKTGQTVEVGTGKIPDDFPKDFPLYPGAKPSGSLSGTNNEDKDGYWLTLTTPDALDKVSAFYKANLKTSGWEIKSTLDVGTNLTLAVAKGDMEGSLTVNSGEDSSDTTILIVIGKKAQ